MPTLSETKLVILSTSAQRANGAVLPLSASLGLNKSTVTSTLKALIKSNLIAERQAIRGDEAWRETEDDRWALFITEAGLAAIGVDDGSAVQVPLETSADSKKKRRVSRKSGASDDKQVSAKPGTKLGLLFDLLKRKHGATIAEIIEATGWQAHSVRGAISGSIKKKLGQQVDIAVEEGRGRVYRIIGVA